MNIVETPELTDSQKAFLLELWNREYPSQLRFGDQSGLNNYLSGLGNTKHLLTKDSKGNYTGWACLFEREKEKWFAIIIDSKMRGRRIGNHLLNLLKAKESVLNGWVIDHNNYVKQNGDHYSSPLSFYMHNDFAVSADPRLETDTISAVKIVWTKK